MARDMDSFFDHSNSVLIIKTPWSPALYKMDKIDSLSILERLVSKTGTWQQVIILT